MRTRMAFNERQKITGYHFVQNWVGRRVGESRCMHVLNVLPDKEQCMYVFLGVLGAVPTSLALKHSLMGPLLWCR